MTMTKATPENETRKKEEVKKPKWLSTNAAATRHIWTVLIKFIKQFTVSLSLCISTRVVCRHFPIYIGLLRHNCHIIDDSFFNFSHFFRFVFGWHSSQNACHTTISTWCRCVRIRLKNNERHILINSANDNFYLNFIHHKLDDALWWYVRIFQNMVMKLIFHFYFCLCAVRAHHPPITTQQPLPFRCSSLTRSDVWSWRKLKRFFSLLRNGVAQRWT